MNNLELSWAKFKDFVDSRYASIQYVDINDNYYLSAFDGPINVTCLIPKSSPAGSDQADFESNYLSTANRTPSAVVTTQEELDNKVLKLACGRASFDGVTNLATVEIKIPGTFTGTDPLLCEGRYVAGGYAFTDAYKFGDRLLHIHLVDNDNILGLGVGAIVKSYTDTDVDNANTGWYHYAAPGGQGEVEIEPIGGYAFCPAGLYLKVVFERTSGSTASEVAVNVWWGKLE